MAKNSNINTETDKQETSNNELRKVVLSELTKYEKNNKNNKLIIQQLQKTIENNKKMNNQEMINKLMELQNILLSEDGKNEDIDLAPLLNEIFKLENLTNKNLKIIEDQVKDINEDNGMNMSYDDLYALMKYNDIL